MESLNPESESVVIYTNPLWIELTFTSSHNLPLDKDYILPNHDAIHQLRAPSVHPAPIPSACDCSREEEASRPNHYIPFLCIDRRRSPTGRSNILFALNFHSDAGNLVKSRGDDEHGWSLDR